ncbi:hypothetical protein PUN28_020652 [Cardiocondyla obscurior]|uniref:Uncharacterized protein n=1 Tax=Cardiocondyla obscurior TaxID=286306 RepID=A0AAW2E8S0_9HYME
MKATRGSRRPLPLGPRKQPEPKATRGSRTLPLGPRGTPSRVTRGSPARRPKLRRAQENNTRFKNIDDRQQRARKTAQNAKI